MKSFKIINTINSEENPTDRQERISWWSQEKLKKAKVMVVGAGAIGNETLKNLALLGIGNIFIVDFDTISTSNLSRTVLFRKNDVGKRKAEISAEKIKDIAFYDDINIDWFHGDLVWDLGTGIYTEMDLVLGCLDNIEARIAINKHCWLTNTPWIDSGMYELGLRVEFYQPPKLPCYQCNLTPQQMTNINKRYSCDYVKLKALSDDKIPTTQITSAIVSGIQVQEAIKYLCGQQVKIGEKIYYQGKNNDFDIFSKMVDENCIAHVNYPYVTDIPIDINNTLNDFLDLICNEEYSGSGASLDFRGDRIFVKKVSCKNCFSEINMMRPTFRINADEFICKKCRNNKKKFEVENSTSEINKETQEIFNINNSGEQLLNMTLFQLGVPHMHIVAVIDKSDNYKYYRLSDKTIFKSIKRNQSKWQT